MLVVICLSFHVELIPLEPLFKMQEDSSLSMFSLISKLLLRYGGSQLVTQNSIVNACLILLGTIFSQIPVTNFNDQTIHQLWMSVLYILDSCLQTYSPNRRRSVCTSPPFYGNDAENLEMRIERSEEEQTIVTTTAELAVYLFGSLFQHSLVLYQLQMDYALESMIQLMETSSNEFALLTMFFFSYGHTVSERGCGGNEWGVDTEMSNTELSLLVARYIMIHFNEFVTVNMGRKDEL